MPLKHAIKSFVEQVFALLLCLPVGVGLLFLAVVMLFSNEGRAVKTRKTLDEGAAAVVCAPADRINPANAGRLVHVQGRIPAEELLHDPVFGVSAPALRLSRTVETYQWREREEQVRDASGERKTTYRYEGTWSAELIDASKFHQRGYENPTAPPFPSKTWSAKVFALGAYKLGTGVQDKVTFYRPLLNQMTNVPPAAARIGFRRLHYSFYRGENEMAPSIGDVRITFSHVGSVDVSVIAAQLGDTLLPFRTQAGETISMVSEGFVSAAEMFRKAHWWNNVKMWLIRVAGFFVMILAFQLVARPAAVLDAWLPTLVPWFSIASGLIGFVLAIAATLVVTSAAWVWHRPTISVPIFLGALCLALSIVCYRRRRLYDAMA